MSFIFENCIILKAKKGDNLFGRTENMRNIHFKGDESLIGQIVNVKITDARANSLMGEVEI